MNKVTVEIPVVEIDGKQAENMNKKTTMTLTSHHQEANLVVLQFGEKKLTVSVKALHGATNCVGSLPRD